MIVIRDDGSYWHSSERQEDDAKRLLRLWTMLYLVNRINVELSRYAIVVIAKFIGFSGQKTQGAIEVLLAMKYIYRVPSESKIDWYRLSKESIKLIEENYKK